MATEPKTIREAVINQNAAEYEFWTGLVVLIITVIGIPLIIPWIIIYHTWYKARYLTWHSIKLTDKGVEVRRGVINRHEINIPLDRITDVTVYQDLGMRWLKISRVTVETAGQTTVTGGVGRMLGVEEPHVFRDAVIKQREKFLEENRKPGSVIPAETSSDDGTSVFKDMRDTLGRIEKLLAKGKK